MELVQLKQLAESIGFTHMGPVLIEALVPCSSVREMCAADRCRLYGKSWGCPPACEPLERIQNKILKYREGLLLQTTGAMADDFDLDTIRETEVLHKAQFDTLTRQARLLEASCFPMSAGACTRCKRCTYPDRPCRHPDRLFPSMEANGLLVSEVCKKSGLAYNYGPKTITYTSCILIGYLS